MKFYSSFGLFKVLSTQKSRLFNRLSLILVQRFDYNLHHFNHNTSQAI